MKSAICFICLLLTLSLPIQGMAGIIVGGTRLIFNGGKDTTSIDIINPDNKNYLVQTWIEDTKGSIGNKSFLVTPPLMQVSGTTQKSLRIIKKDKTITSDREELYFLFVKSIPEKTNNSASLQIAVKTRIKLIYRPKDIKGNIDDAMKNIEWKINGHNITATNNSPFYITFYSLKFNGNSLINSLMLSPFSTTSIENTTMSNSGDIEWRTINDFGMTAGPYTAFTK